MKYCNQVYSKFMFKIFIDIALIGRTDWEYPEEISIINDSLFHIKKAPSSLLAAWSIGAKFTQLPNGYWLVCGGCISKIMKSEYRLFKQGPNQWTKFGTMQNAIWEHASVYIDGALLTTGGVDLSRNAISHHEHFSFEGGVKNRKELPIALRRHRATIFGNHKMLISGGLDIHVSKSHNMSYA